MPIWKMQCSFWMDSVLPRDAFVITPHFNDQIAGSDPQGLCDDLVDALDAYTAATMQTQVKAYDAQGSQPVYPQGSAIRNVGASPAGHAPREIAVCLSFYADRNIPRHRGRLYIPGNILDASPDLRPTPYVRDKVAELAPIFANLGGPDVDWCVYSRADNVARSVQQWWVDDEYDTIRSRGLRATTRTTGAVNE